MKPPIKLEFTTSVKEKKRLSGILAIPRISRNSDLYLPEELAKAHGKTVLILWKHEGSPKSDTDPASQSNVIGSMRIFWDPDLLQLKYEAEVDRDLPALLLDGDLLTQSIKDVTTDRAASLFFLARRMSELADKYMESSRRAVQAFVLRLDSEGEIYSGSA